MEDQSTAVFTVTLVLIILSTIVVALRCVSRAIVVGVFVLHDYIMIYAWVISLVFSVSVCYSSKRGLGLHQWDIPLEWRQSFNNMTYLALVLYNPALMATKTSILVFYLTLMARDRVFRWVTYTTLLVVNAAGLAITLINIYRCSPINAAWVYPTPADAVCIDRVKLYLASVPVNIITDIAILLLPIPIITRMNLPLKQKMILVITFSIGVFVTVVEVIRIAHLQNASIGQYRRIGDGSDGEEDKGQEDFSWYAAWNFVWSVVGVNVGILCACVPTLKPLVIRVIPKLIRNNNASSVTETEMITCSIHYPAQKAQSEQNSQADSDTLRSPSVASRNHNQMERGDPPAAGEDPQICCPEALTSDNTTAPEKIRTPYFDFVKFGNPKSLTDMDFKESLPMLTAVTGLLFFKGFTYNLLKIFNTRILTVMDHVGSIGVVGARAAHSGGYLLGSFLAMILLKKYGFKATLVAGLGLYACGVLLFWSSAVIGSLAAFVVFNIVVGTGISIIEAGANTLVTLCGPPQFSEMRLSTSLAFEAIGTFLSPFLAQRLFLSFDANGAFLMRAQWAYLAVSLFYVILAIMFYYLPVPEVSDQELVELSNKRRAANLAKFGNFRIIWITFGLAVTTQFFYFGGLEGLDVHFRTLISFIKPNTDTFGTQIVGYGLFAVGRFLTAGALLFAKPRSILLFLSTCLAIFGILSINVQGAGGVAVAVMIYLFGGGIFGLTFATSLRGMGDHTRTAAALLTSTASGGAFIPLIQYGIAKRRDIQFSFIVQAILFILCVVFPIHLNSSQAVKRQVDPDLKNRQPQPNLDNLNCTSRMHKLLGHKPECFTEEDSIFPSSETIRQCFRQARGGSSHHGREIMYNLSTWPSRMHRNSSSLVKGTGFWRFLSFRRHSDEVGS